MRCLICAPSGIVRTYQAMHELKDVQVDCDVEALKIYCPNKNRNGCGWIGEIACVDGHLRGCKISCSKCKEIVYFSTMKSHLDTECPCYCPYCDITAEGEVINSEHKEKCHKFPLSCPNNTGVNNAPHDKNIIDNLGISLIKQKLIMSCKMKLSMMYLVRVS